MGQRITWRGRTGYPWPLRTLEGPLGDMPHNYHHGIGPLPMRAVVELLYRVSEIEYSFSGTNVEDPPYEEQSGSSAGTMVITGAATELEQFVATSRNDPSAGDIQSIELMAGDYGTTEGHAGMIAIKTGYEFEIYRDTATGSFWLSGFIGIFAIDPTNGGFVSMHSATTASGSGSITLVLNCGTFVLTTAGPTGTGTATLTATKWFPYATVAGAAAWDVDTGAAANGGPGA